MASGETDDPEWILEALRSEDVATRHGALRDLTASPARFSPLGSRLIAAVAHVLGHPLRACMPPERGGSLTTDSDPFDDAWKAMDALRAIGSEEAFEAAHDFWARTMRPLVRFAGWCGSRRAKESASGTRPLPPWCAGGSLVQVPGKPGVYSRKRERDRT